MDANLFRPSATSRSPFLVSCPLRGSCFLLIPEVLIPAAVSVQATRSTECPLRAQRRRGRPEAAPATASAASPTGSSSGSCRTSRHGRRGSGAQEPAAAAAMGREAATAAMGREECARGRRIGQGRSRPERGSRSGDGQGRRADLGGGAPGPSVAAGAAATSGSERGSRSGDGDEAKLRARAPAAGCLLLFFLFAKNALVPVGLSNRYQWMPKAPGFVS